MLRVELTVDSSMGSETGISPQILLWVTLPFLTEAKAFGSSTTLPETLLGSTCLRTPNEGRGGLLQAVEFCARSIQSVAL